MFYVIYNEVEGYFSSVSYVEGSESWQFVPLNESNSTSGRIAVFTSEDEAKQMMKDIKNAIHGKFEIQCLIPSTITQ